jgi:hypothetical protein
MVGTMSVWPGFLSSLDRMADAAALRWMSWSRMLLVMWRRGVMERRRRMSWDERTWRWRTVSIFLSAFGHRCLDATWLTWGSTRTDDSSRRISASKV